LHFLWWWSYKRIALRSLLGI